MIEYPNTTWKPLKSFYIIRYHWGPGNCAAWHSLQCNTWWGGGGGGRREVLSAIPSHTFWGALSSAGLLMSPLPQYPCLGSLMERLSYSNASKAVGVGAEPWVPKIWQMHRCTLGCVDYGYWTVNTPITITFSSVHVVYTCSLLAGNLIAVGRVPVWKRP